MRKVVALVMPLLLAFSFGSSVSAQDSSGIKVVIDGETQKFPQKPLTVSGTTLVPMRAIFEKLGAEVQWIADAGTVIGNKSGMEVVLAVGSKGAAVNGERVVLSAPAQVVNGSVMVPLRFISESLGADVYWEQWSQTAYINSHYGKIGRVKKISTFLNILLDEDGEIWTWSYDEDTDAVQFQKVEDRVKSMVDDSFEIAIVKTNGTIWVLKIGYTDFVQVKGIEDAINYILDRDVSYRHLTYVKSDQTLWRYQLWVGETEPELTLLEKKYDEVYKMTTLEGQTFEIDKEGTLWASGRARVNETHFPDSFKTNLLGTGIMNHLRGDYFEPKKVMANVEQISLGLSHAVALQEDGTVWSWGVNKFGQLGDETTTDRSSPVKVFSDAVQVAAGYGHTLVLKSDGTVWACGDRGSGFEDGAVYKMDGGPRPKLVESVPNPVFKKVEQLSDVVYIAAGWHKSYAVKKDGTIWLWGGSSTSEYENIETFQPVELTEGYRRSMLTQ
ncbi:stalk domain-containing protein [Paenibacillus sp. TRM 82003]|nr:stalk domain-containing protein [Paenibacillus sp. TRM 82003]